MSVREHWINVRVNPEELARIREKQKELGIRNTGAYMRKMAMDGYCVNLDLSDVAQVSTLLRRCRTLVTVSCSPREMVVRSFADTK